MPLQSIFFDTPHPKYAPHLHIIEVRGTDIIFRLMGTQLVEKWGVDKTGDVLGEDQPKHIQEALFNNSYAALSTPCGVQGLVKLEANKGSRIEIESVGLPLRIKNGKEHRLVSFSQTLRTLSYGEMPTNYVSFSDTKWIDIGAGVPEGDPDLIEDTKPN